MGSCHVSRPDDVEDPRKAVVAEAGSQPSRTELREDHRRACYGRLVRLLDALLGYAKGIDRGPFVAALGRFIPTAGAHGLHTSRGPDSRATARETRKAPFPAPSRGAL